MDINIVAEAAAASSIVLQLACLFFSGEADFSKTAKRKDPFKLKVM